jgi:hypothetical protein
MTHQPEKDVSHPSVLISPQSIEIKQQEENVKTTPNLRLTNNFGLTNTGTEYLKFYPSNWNQFFGYNNPEVCFLRNLLVFRFILLTLFLGSD